MGLCVLRTNDHARQSYSGVVGADSEVTQLAAKSNSRSYWDNYYEADDVSRALDCSLREITGDLQ